MRLPLRLSPASTFKTWLYLQYCVLEESPTAALPFYFFCNLGAPPAQAKCISSWKITTNRRYSHRSSILFKAACSFSIQVSPTYTVRLFPKFIFNFLRLPIHEGLLSQTMSAVNINYVNSILIKNGGSGEG